MRFELWSVRIDDPYTRYRASYDVTVADAHMLKRYINSIFVKMYIFLKINYIICM